MYLVQQLLQPQTSGGSYGPSLSLGSISVSGAVDKRLLIYWCSCLFDKFKELIFGVVKVTCARSFLDIIIIYYGKREHTSQ